MPVPMGVMTAVPPFDGVTRIAAQRQVEARRNADDEQRLGSLLGSALVPVQRRDDGGERASPSTSLLASALRPDPDASRDTGEERNWLDAGPPFHIRVSGFERGHPVRYRIMVHRGEVSWPIRRRFREVIAVHQTIAQALGPQAYSQGLPRPPPRVSLRGVVCGERSRAFLLRRAEQIQDYFDALLRFIPEVDHCEALYAFLCDADLPDDYAALVRLGEMIGPAAGTVPEPLSDEVVAKLPRACSATSATRDGPKADAAASSSSDSDDGLSAWEEADICVVCQDPMDVEDEEQDVRRLPCGHQFHFKCVARWLKERNTCCVCQAVAIDDTAEREASGALSERRD